MASGLVKKVIYPTIDPIPITSINDAKIASDVKDNNRCDIPENPKLILIPYELIQLIDSNS